MSVEKKEITFPREEPRSITPLDSGDEWLRSRLTKLALERIREDLKHVSELFEPLLRRGLLLWALVHLRACMHHGKEAWRQK